MVLASFFLIFTLGIFLSSGLAIETDRYEFSYDTYEDYQRWPSWSSWRPQPPSETKTVYSYTVSTFKIYLYCST